MKPDHVIIALIVLGIVTLALREVIIPIWRRNRIVRMNRDMKTVDGFTNYFKALSDMFGYDKEER